MSLRTRWAVAVFLAATAAAAPNAYAQPQPGQGSLGMRIGVPYFLGDSDTKLGQKPRMLISANFSPMLTATMTPNSTSDYELYLYDGNEKILGWSENGKGVAETVTVTNSGSAAVAYYVRVHYYAGGTGSTNGKYTIKLAW